MDANIDDVLSVKKELISGYGDGYSVFFGLSRNNSMCVADYIDVTKNLENKETVKFKAGDCLMLRYGTVHAGNKNDTNSETFKSFTDIFTDKKQVSESQLWVIEGKGFSKSKP